VPSPATSPALSVGPSDFHLLCPLKKHLAGNQSVTDSNMKQTVTNWTDTGHQFLLCQNTNLGASMEKNVKKSAVITDSWFMIFAHVSLRIWHCHGRELKLG
jgi:hypothetical protein